MLTSLIAIASAATTPTLTLTTYSDATCATATGSRDLIFGACSDNWIETAADSLALYHGDEDGEVIVSTFTDVLCATPTTPLKSRNVEYGACVAGTIGGATTKYYKVTIDNYWTSGSYVQVKTFAAADTCTGTEVRTQMIPAIAPLGPDAKKTVNAQVCTSDVAGSAFACIGTNVYKYAITIGCAIGAPEQASTAGNPVLMVIPTTGCGYAGSSSTYECIKTPPAADAPGGIKTPTKAPTAAPTEASGLQPWGIGLIASLCLFGGVTGVVLILIILSIVLKYTIRIPSSLVVRGEALEDFEPTTDKFIWTDSIETIGGVPTKDSEIYATLKKAAAADSESGATANFKLVVTKSHGEKPFCDFPACQEDEEDE